MVHEEMNSGLKGRAVAVAAAADRGLITYISNVATLPDKRGKGYAGAAIVAALGRTSRAAILAEALGVKRTICLATESGQGPCEAFRKLGFILDFEAEGYTLAA
jgi:predicted GNAT family acetyltransferase